MADTEPTPSVEALAATPLACDERVKNLEAGLGKERTALRLPMGIRPSKVAAWKEIAELGPVISISNSDQMLFEGQRLPRSEVMLALQNLGDDRESVPLLVIADAGATANAVYAAIKGHPEKLVPYLVVARDRISDPRDSAELPPGSAAWVSEWLAGYKAEESAGKRATQLRSGITRAAGTGCVELSTAFRTIANAFGHSRQTAAEEIPKALAACQCNGVDPGFEMIFTLSRARPDGLGQLPLSKKPPSALAADGTVDKLARALSEELP